VKGNLWLHIKAMSTFIGPALFGKDIVLKTIIKYSSFKLIYPYIVAYSFYILIIQSSISVRWAVAFTK
jgi:hypothetical protein